MTLAWQRIFRFALALLAGGSVWATSRLYDLSLRDPSYVDGWILAASVLFLALFNVRKKIPVVPLLSAGTWTVAHIYGGWFAVVVFLVHTEMALPGGPLETILWIVFLLLAASGMLGTYIVATFPQRLSRHGAPHGLRRQGERLIFERIPIYRAELARAAEELALKSIAETKSTTISDFYAQRLQPYFSEPRGFVYHLMESDRPLHMLRDEMSAQQRYLNARGREVLSESAAMIAAKDNLDYHFALQLTMKAWLFVHIPLVAHPVPWTQVCLTRRA